MPCGNPENLFIVTWKEGGTMNPAKKRIDGIKHATEKAQDIRWDDGQPGLGVRVYPSGSRFSFCLIAMRGVSILSRLAATAPLPLSRRGI